jgi:hypothetical protein
LEQVGRETRKIQDRRHADNQQAFGEMRQATQIAIAEVRIQANEQFKALTAQISLQGAAALTLPKLRLTALASVGLVCVMLIGWLAEAGVKWLMERILHNG